ncbi:Gfo/Idh/MocA family protein [Paenibacillus macquariensis]|uniref:Predicted dehydrogenase n=1 Tax=Paenibacillus macquariensis TaxID=948756 RepID=A0ABY1JN27_9BACL|nr:Gfo/Idh/MocA family oxidoreductase [Paenibacillus macquariensis]MEC0092227.1 Gfo/Idh/MocA family oxidoreductase [Paenibacillus macquariensis]OAB37226.1 lipopolysaccharide biosynthesis protein [Paenibacillus macquariensis subsp. macquariensis]SIQ48381.1 Predicted dehydrogenase [Paenibacillus macquariensis]
MIKAAVIGLGDISNIHIPAIQANPNIELVAVCDRDETLRDTLPGVSFYTDLHDMLEQETLDCVHICLPHYLHLPATKACVEKGVHVFLEKPLALNADEGLTLVKLEEDYKDVKICVCLQNRFNETFVKIQEIVQSKQYGNVVGIKGLVTWSRPQSYYDVKPWRGSMKYAGGGVMINQSIHTLDLMQLLGGEIESIRGSIDNLLDYDIEVEDTATAHIQFVNGARGLYYATIANTGNSSVELQVLFENGELTIKDSVLTRLNAQGEKEDLIEDTKLLGTKSYYGASHVSLINQFYSCIANNVQDYVHVKDALIAMKMIDTIRKSSEVKRTMNMEGLIQ